MLVQYVECLYNMWHNLGNLQNVVAESVVELVHVLFFFHTLN